MLENLCLHQLRSPSVKKRKLTQPELYPHPKDRQQCNTIFVAIDGSAFGKTNGVDINRVIAEYATGEWRICSNEGCCALMSILEGDRGYAYIHAPILDLYFCGECKNEIEYRHCPRIPCPQPCQGEILWYPTSWTPSLDTCAYCDGTIRECDTCYIGSCHIKSCRTKWCADCFDYKFMFSYSCRTERNYCVVCKQYVCYLHIGSSNPGYRRNSQCVCSECYDEESPDHYLECTHCGGCYLLLHESCITAYKDEPHDMYDLKGLFKSDGSAWGCCVDYTGSPGNIGWFPMNHIYKNKKKSG